LIGSAFALTLQIRNKVFDPSESPVTLDHVAGA
jgi:hypothetical protein